MNSENVICGLNTSASSLQSSPQYKALCHSLQKIISWSHIINVGSRGKSCGNWTRERNAICPCLTSNHCYVENRIYLRKGLLQNTAFKSIQKLTHRKSCWKPRFRRFLATFFLWANCSEFHFATDLFFIHFSSVYPITTKYLVLSPISTLPKKPGSSGWICRRDTSIPPNPKPMKLETFQSMLDWLDNRRKLTVDSFDKAKKFCVQQLTKELGYMLQHEVPKLILYIIFPIAIWQRIYPFHECL